MALYMSANPRTFTPKKAAEAVDCSPDTIRRYCGLYSRHLSEGANPPKGKPRLLTSEDVALLRIAKLQTEMGETIEAVDTILESVALDLPDEEPVELAVVEAPGGNSEALVLMRQVATSLDRIANQEDRFTRLEEDLRDLRIAVQARKPEARIVEAPKPVFALGSLGGFVLGVVVVVALVALFALVAWLIP